MLGLDVVWIAKTPLADYLWCVLGHSYNGNHCVTVEVTWSVRAN